MDIKEPEARLSALIRTAIENIEEQRLSVLNLVHPPTSWRVAIGEDTSVGIMRDKQYTGDQVVAHVLFVLGALDFEANREREAK